MAGHRMVTIPASNMKKSITQILYDQGYILKYKFEETSNKQGQILIALKYDKETKKPVIQMMKRVSRPGLRHYVKSSAMPSVINGLGTAVVSTSKGVLTDKVAKKENVGGEVLFYIY
jgi:small subunit ribosomal protein S8